MKKILLLATTLATTFGVAQAQQTILNGNFENWKVTNYDIPNFWNTSEADEPGMGSAVKTSDSRSGSAIKLTSVDAIDYVAFGFFANTDGDPTEGEGGAPYTQQPTTLNGYYKGNFVNGDSAIILVTFKKNGTIISSAVFALGTNTNTFTAFSFPISVPTAPDSVILAAASSNVLGNPDISPGSVVYFDDLSFGGSGITEGIQNGNFDNWTAVTDYQVQDWSNYGKVERTTDKYKGETAIKLMVEQYTDGTYGSGISLGEMTENGSSKVPFSSTADTLVFYYKLVTSTNDSASVYGNLSAMGISVGGFYQYLSPTNTFTRVEIPLVPFSTPDSMGLSFNMGSGQRNPSVNSYLVIDEVTLKSQPLNTGLFNMSKHANLADVYPNPFQNELKVNAGNVKNINYSIADITGKVIATGKVSGGSVNTSNLPTGMYFITLSTNNEILAVKKVVKN